MNKKFLFGMFAASMLMVTSCSNEELGEVQSGNEATVSFTLGVENAAQTRAISDGTGATELHYTVFDNEGNVVHATKVENGVTYPKQIVLTLAKGKTYQVAFWAQNPDCEAYTLDANMNVTVDYAGLNNDETRDAFCKTTNKFTVTGNASQNVVLRRPFAQLNVGITEEAWTAAVNAGVTVAQSEVSFTNAATKLNVLTGEVAGAADVAYNLSNVPTETLKVTLDNEPKEYMYLSMCYLLVNTGEGNPGTGQATINDVDFTFTTADGNYGVELNEGDGLATVPVQRNWRTNILLEKFLTGDIEFSITLDPAYINDKNEWGTLIPEEEEQPEVENDPTTLSVEWATKNLGADSEDVLGNYYAWADPNIEKSSYNWGSYNYFIVEDNGQSVTEEMLGKYITSDGLTTVDASDDPATLALGEGWRMPTQAEMQELIDECDWLWNADKNGFDITHKVDGTKIFLNGTQYKWQSKTFGNSSNDCMYWTSTLGTNVMAAFYLEGNSNGEKEIKEDAAYVGRHAGLQIRPVRAKN